MGIDMELMTQIAHGIAKQFGSCCEVVLHDLTSENLEESVILIENGHVTNRKAGDGPSHVVLEALSKNGENLTDHLAYLTRTNDGRILKSSTLYLKNPEGKVEAIFSINYDITNFMLIGQSIGSLTASSEDGKASATGQPDRITQNVNDLLDDLIDQSVALVGKPVALMTKEDKTTAIQFLNRTGAFLITKSGDKVSNYFGISKFTLYNYIDSAGKE